MRKRRLVLEGSFCDMNLYADGPQTVAEAKTLGPQPCPRLNQCKDGGLGAAGLQCVMATGLEVARFALRGGTSVARQMTDYRQGHFVPKEGWVFSHDRKRFEIVPEGRASSALVEQFAHIALNDSDPSTDEKKRREVGSSFQDVVAYATTKEGAIDLSKMEELEGRFGSNGGRGCDVRSGPCSCGAFH